MAINSYSTLKTAIANWLTRDDLTIYLEDFIALCEARIYRELKIRCMETALNSTISSGVIAVPTGYKAMKFAYVDGSPVGKLTRKDAEWVYQNYPDRSSNGKPEFMAREGDNFIFGPYPDSAYTIKGIYYKKLDALSESNMTNWFTTNAPDLLLFGALCEAEPFIKNDPRLAMWNGKYEFAKSRIQLEDADEEFSGSILMASRG